MMRPVRVAGRIAAQDHEAVEETVSSVEVARWVRALSQPDGALEAMSDLRGDADLTRPEKTRGGGKKKPGSPTRRRGGVVP